LADQSFDFFRFHKRLQFVMTNLDRNGAEEGMKMLRITSRGVNRGDEMFQETGQFVNAAQRKGRSEKKKGIQGSS